MQTSALSSLAAAGMLASALALGGCATKGFVRDQVGQEDQKVQAQGQQLQAQDAHLGQLDASTREALDRATAAGKLAEGKFLYDVVLSDDSVKFPVDGSELSEEAKARLLEFTTKLKTDNRNVYLEIQGYTDNTGTKPLNMRLGEERAEAVRRYLNEQGVALNRISTISYGPDRPVAANSSRVGRAQNRRVVIVVLA